MTTDSVLTYNQKKTFTKTYVKGGETFRITAEVRYDDECRNGHNTFAITGEIKRKARNGCWVWESAGCIHEQIAKHFPELAHLIKWHLCNSDGPTYYFENTLYHASNCESTGHKVGEVKRTKKVLKFKDFPVTFKLERKFLESLVESNVKDLEVREVAHKPEPDGYVYPSKYTFNSYVCEWYECPFDSQQEAEQYLEAIQNLDWEIIEVPCDWYKEKPRELDGARHCAIWEDAPDEVLCLPTEELRQKLAERLPGLMAQFRKDVEDFGFVY